MKLLLLMMMLLAGGGVLGNGWRAEQPQPQQHEWVVQIDGAGGDETADAVAASHGLVNAGRIPYLKNKFVLRLPKGGDPLHRQRISTSLANRSEITWQAYQAFRRRDKRDLLDINEIPGRNQVPRDWRYSGIPVSHPGLFSPARLSTVSLASAFVDPFWPRQWYLHGAAVGDLMGVEAAWRRNITGRGVLVAVVDDGLEMDHPDLRAAVEPSASFDYARGLAEPRPVYFNFKEELDGGRTGHWHGTRCAGVIAMTANNTFCGVGIAFHARLAGVKILEGAASDLREARGLTHQLDKVHVYSCSWGPPDDGATLEAPRPLVREALRAGAELGRGSRGAVYVWASGNGGGNGDNCNCDGYSAAIYTLAVGSVGRDRASPWYAESCSAVMASAFSSSSGDQPAVVTTDLRHQCATDFTGTSAAAPAAAGIVALLLEANPDLTWRDIQHAVVWTSNSAPLRAAGGWRENAAGHHYHHRFGFGLFNVPALLDLVAPPPAATDGGRRRAWRRVPDAERPDEVPDGAWDCPNGRSLRHSRPLRCQLMWDSKSGSRRAIRYLEHVQLRLSLTYSQRGALAIYLTSGAGSRSQLLTRRREDNSRNGFRDWEFLTVHFWGENPNGEWRLLIEDQSEHRGNVGRLNSAQLILHGTSAMPLHRARAGGRRQPKTDDD